MTRFILLSALGAALLGSTVVAQPQWTVLSPSSAPSVRAEPASAASPTGIFLFGGMVGPTAYDDELWQFGISWNKLTPPAGTPTPPARRGASAAYDTHRNRFVMFGGFAEPVVMDIWINPFADTWEWTGSQWESKTKAPHPSPRAWASMVYDETRRRCMLFGGAAGINNYNDTWAWNGSNWSQVVPGTSPSGRRAAAMAYNSKSGETLLFGGEFASGVSASILSDTWRFDGSNWRQLNTTTIPGGTGITQAKMVYDASRDRYVLFGGMTGPSGYNSDVWEFDGINWQKRNPPAPAPVARRMPTFEYMSAQKRSILFGGQTSVFLRDTWQYRTNVVADFVETGTGCPSSIGVPSQHALEQPWIGGNLAMEVRNVPVNSVTWLVTGWRTVNYPVFPHTRPSCVLSADPTFIAVLVNDQLTGLPTLSVPIPNRPSLIGQVLYTQAGVLEQGAGSAGGLSPLGNVVFGAR